jgi:hypothetical protein
VVIEQFAGQAQRAQRILGGVAAGGIGQQGVALGGKASSRLGWSRCWPMLVRRIADRDDLRPARLRPPAVSPRSRGTCRCRPASATSRPCRRWSAGCRQRPGREGLGGVHAPILVGEACRTPTSRLRRPHPPEHRTRARGPPATRGRKG